MKQTVGSAVIIGLLFAGSTAQVSLAATGSDNESETIELLLGDGATAERWSELRNETGIGSALFEHEGEQWSYKRMGPQLNAKKETSLNDSQPSLHVAASEEGALAINWSKINGASVYYVYVGESLVYQGSATQVRLEKVDPTPLLEVRVTAEGQGMHAIDTDSQDDASQLQYATLSLPINAPVATRSYSAEASLQTTYYRTAALTYRTFISPAGADAFPCDATAIVRGSYFGGDNRGYSTDPFASSRTRQTVLHDFYSGYFSNSAYTSPTRLYSSSGVLLDEQVAPNDTLLLLDAAAGGVGGSFAIQGRSANPFCDALSIVNRIQYDADVTLYQNGGYAMYGSRRPAPHHEAHVVFTTPDLQGTYTSVVEQVANQGFACLTGICGTTPIFGYKDGLPPGAPVPV